VVERLAASLVAAAVAVAVVAVPAAAHGTGPEFTVPVPPGYLAVGAGVAVAGTAVVLATWGESPGGEYAVARVPAGAVRTVVPVARWGFLLAVAAAVAHGVVGPANYLENLATVLVWPIWLKGVGLVAILAGSPWRVLAPWRTLHAGLSKLEGRPLGFAPYPEWAGRWPAFAGGVVLVVVENLTVVPREPGLTAAFVAGWTLLMLAGGVVFGPDFFDRADPLAVLYGLLGRVAPLQVVAVPEPTEASSAWELRARAPWSGCERSVDDVATAAFAVLAVYAVGFDGLVESAPYRELEEAVRAIVGAGGVADLVPFALGLVAAWLAFLAATLVAGRTVGGSRRRTAPPSGSAGQTDGAASTLLSFAPTLLPIAAGYEAAHNLGYVLVFLGRLPAVVGLAPAVSPLDAVPVGAVWTAQVGLVVAGHVVAVVAAHAVSRRLARDGATAGSGTGAASGSGGVDRAATLVVHAPVVVLMVAYTVWSLWVLTLPAAA
jgi:hypothetical protein